MSLLGSITRLFCVFSLAGIACLALPETANAQPPARSGYSVAWFDEFDGNSLDLSRWKISDTNNTTNNSLQDYRPSQVSVGQGLMAILSEDTPSRGRPYLSGLIETRNLQKYGRFDIRAKLPTSKGMWPAIWLLSDVTVAPWPSEGEIDIMENRGTQPNLTSTAFHYGTNGNGEPFRHFFRYTDQTAVHDGAAQNYHDEFHTYSVEWDPEQIRFYVDDVHHWTVRDDDVDGFLTDRVGQMRLIINTAVGGDFLENPDGETVWPQRFEVDYVHAYTLSSEDRVLTFENGGFEDNGGSLAAWTKFGDVSFGNNSASNISSGNQRVSQGAEALKLFGQFNGDTNYSGIEQGITVEAGDELLATAEAFVASNDSIAGTGNAAEIKIDYYRKQHGLFGSADYIRSDSVSLANSLTANNQWHTRELVSTVPQGAVEARLVLLFIQPDNAGGAVHVDNVQFGLEEEPTILGDFDTDGDVDVDDINFYTNNLGQPASFNPDMDLNNDQLINLADHDLHVSTLVQTNGLSGTVIGDINFDGTVNVLGDAFALIANLGFSDVGYGQGDLNADGRVDVLGDAFRLISNLGMSAP